MKYFALQPMKMEPIEGSETSAIINQTPGNYPKGNLLYSVHGESLKSRIHLFLFRVQFLSLCEVRSDFTLAVAFVCITTHIEGFCYLISAGTQGDMATVDG